MTASGYNWGAWAFLDYSSGSDIDAVAVNDEATLTSDEFSCDNLAGVEVGITSVEDNTGAVDGDVYAYLLGTVDGTNWETISDDPALVAVIDQAQNATRYAVFSVDPGEYGSFKVLIDNDCGQQVAISIKVRTATFDTA